MLGNTTIFKILSLTVLLSLLFWKFKSTSVSPTPQETGHDPIFMLMGCPLTRDEVLETKRLSPSNAHVSKVHNPGSPKTRSANFFHKGPESKYFSFAGHTVSATSTWISFCSMKAAIENMETHGHSCRYSNTFYLLTMKFEFFIIFTFCKILFFFWDFSI